MQTDARVQALDVVVTQVDCFEAGEGVGGDVEEVVVARDEGDEGGEEGAQAGQRACEAVLTDVEALQSRGLRI